MIAFTKILLKIMRTKGIESDIVTDKALKYRWKIGWNSMLARDRDVLVNEVAIRANENLGTHKHLMDMLEDVTDSEEEWAGILTEGKDLAKIQALIKAAQAANGSDGRSGGEGGQKASDAKSSAGVKPTSAATGETVSGKSTSLQKT